MVTYLVEEGNHHTSVSDRAIYQELGIPAQSWILRRCLGQRKNGKSIVVSPSENITEADQAVE